MRWGTTAALKGPWRESYDRDSCVTTAVGLQCPSELGTSHIVGYSKGGRRTRADMVAEWRAGHFGPEQLCGSRGPCGRGWRSPEVFRLFGPPRHPGARHRGRAAKAPPCRRSAGCAPCQEASHRLCPASARPAGTRVLGFEVLSHESGFESPNVPHLARPAGRSGVFVRVSRGRKSMRHLSKQRRCRCFWPKTEHRKGSVLASTRL